MHRSETDHYATLGVDRHCSQVQIRHAYRLRAKRFHPDVNPHDKTAQDRIQALNAAYKILSDPVRRRAYDHELREASRATAPGHRAKIEHNIPQEVRLRIEDFLRGTSLAVTVKDPANLNGVESYEVDVPAGSAPGMRLRLRRSAPFEGGFVLLRLKAFPSARFKLRGSDLSCDLRISTRRAEAGGTETITGPTGIPLRVSVPPNAKRGELVTISGQGMPKLRGGRGDLVVRLCYRPEVRVSRSR